MTSGSLRIGNVYGHGYGVVGVVGLVFDRTIGDLERLASLAGARIGPDAFRIDGMEIWTKPVATELPSVGEKVFPLVAVVLAAPRIDQLARAENVVEISFLDAPAVLIRTNPRSWDLVVRPGRGG